MLNIDEAAFYELFCFTSGLQEKCRFARAKFSYIAKRDDELAIKVGSVIEVLWEEEDGWWFGKLNGKTGFFPSNHVKEISE